MGEGRRSLASPLRFQTNEGTLSLAAEEAQPPPDRRPDRSPLAVAALVLSTVTRDGEGEVALGNSAGSYVLPTASTIQAGLASFTNTPANETISLINGSGAGVYPIINYEYAIVSTSQASATRAQDRRAFLNWAISTGTGQLAQVNFQPLPPSVVTLSQAQIAKIKG
jgi:phosphate transport system substrate-binding protein